MIRFSDRHIARNTLLLMIRMGILMLLNLLAVRFVRHGLGLEDYGILNAVTGFVQLLVCFNTVLSVSGQRYLNTAMGQNNPTLLNDCFRVSVHISRAMALGVFVLLETVGLWFVCTRMNYPADRFTGVIIIYQAAIVTFVSTLLQVPYLAAVMAHEKMHVFAGISVLEGVLKFALALALVCLPGDKMALYGCGLAIASLLSTALYVAYTRSRFDETRPHTVQDRSLYRQMLTFSGWTLYGTVAGTLMLQGNMLLLNIHFGPLTNAAFAVALQIYNAIAVFGNNIILAVRPQLTTNYSMGNHREVKRLFGFTNALMILVVIVLVAPIEIWMPHILQLWLGDADAQTVLFSRLMTVVVAILLLGNPITSLIQAIGRVREYHLPVETLTVLSLPLGYLFVRMGYGAESVCLAIIICVSLAQPVRMLLIRHYYFCPKEESKL